tara:strand:- start:27956 stop:28666 length:711 start_codon:yes stop_codon:yes gene_type:complete
LLRIGKWLAVISLVFLLIGTIAYFYAQDDMIEILDPKTTNLVELPPNTSQSVELERMGLYVALRVDGEDILPELKLINSSGTEIEGREAAWYDFDRAGVDGTVYQTVMVFENTKNERYVIYNEGETTLWLIDETSNQIEVMTDSGFIAISCGFCMGIPLAILAVITLLVGWRKGIGNQKVSISDELYIDKEGGKIKIVTDIQNVPDPFIKNNGLITGKTENIEKSDTFWEDWDNQK